MDTTRIRPGRRRLLAIAAAVVTLAATTLNVSSSVGARNAPTPSNAPVPITLPGLAAGHYDVTLPTGDQVRLAAAGPHVYTVEPVSRPSDQPPLTVRAQGTAAGTTSAVAVPAIAQRLVANGALDAGLFDLTYLATHGDGRPDASLPVTVQYDGAQTATTLTAKAKALPGATLAATHPAAGTVDVTVAASKAAAFWTALTGQPSATTAAAIAHPSASLANGAVHAWPTGHRSSAPARPATGEPTYTASELITRSPDASGKCNLAGDTLCLVGGGYGQVMVALTGSAAGSAYLPSDVTCVDNPCTTYRVTFTNLPAGIYSTTSGLGFYFLDQHWQWVAMVAPQLTVAGDTTFTVDATPATPVTLSTPRPVEALGGELSEYRRAPNGVWYTDMGFWNWGQANFWATPTPRVTVGSYHFNTNWLLGKPHVRMSVAGSDLALAPEQLPNTRYDSGAPVPRFRSGPVGVVDAGYGRTEDFQSIDARGKVALIRVADDECLGNGDSGMIRDWQLADAVAAGVAGLLIDASNPAAAPDGWCEMPLFYQSDPTIPTAALTVAEANALLASMAKGPVTLDVSSYPGNSPYLYTPHLYHEGQIPASLHTVLTDRNVVAVTEHYHADQPVTAQFIYAAWRPDEYLAETAHLENVVLPATIVEYRYPRTPDLIQLRDVSPQGSSEAEINDTVDPTTAATDTWLAGPTAPGADVLHTSMLTNLPGKLGIHGNWAAFMCDFCRQKDTFHPVFDLISGADPYVINGLYGFSVGSIHLYRNGTEIAPNETTGVASYTLPPERSSYHLTAQANNITTAWDFSSARPTTDNTPDGFACWDFLYQNSTEPCTADPLLFLRYDAHVSDTNTLTPSALRRLDVTAYHLATNAPAVTDLALSVSFDGGHTWRPLHTTRTGNGNYAGLYTIPPSGQTDGHLSIKAQAHDAPGDAISQTIIDAVPLEGGN